MIIREVIISMNKTRFFTILLVIQLIITSCICNLVLNTIFSMISDYNKFDSLIKDKKYFRISDRLFDSDLEEIFWKSKNSLERIKQYYQEISTSSEYKYLEIIDQKISFVDDSIMESLSENSSDGYLSHIDGKYYRSVQNVFVNMNTIEEFDFKVAEGRLFTKEDFNIDQNTTTVPIMVGYSFKDKYKIGDILDGWLYFKNFKLEVVGILEEDTRIIKTNIETQTSGSSNDIIYLDRRFVSPALNCTYSPMDEDDRFFQQVLYIMKTNASIVVSNNYNLGDLQSKIDNLRLQYDIFEFNVIRVSNSELELLKLASKDSLNVMMILAISVLIFTVISLSTILSAKLLKNIKEYGIHLLVGATKLQVICYVISEIIALLMISNIFAYLITKIAFKNNVSYTISWIFISILAAGIGSILPIKTISNNYIDANLRRLI